MKPRNLIWRTPLIMLGIFLCAAVWAQTDCTQQVSGSDQGCVTSTPDDCDDCTVVNFTAACTGVYYLDVWTACTDADHKCYMCQGHALLYKVQGNDLQLIGNCHTIDCDDQDCTATCFWTNAPLSAGQQYRLCVCLIRCPGEYDCDDCNDSCTAYACVRYGNVAPCWE